MTHLTTRVNRFVLGRKITTGNNFYYQGGRYTRQPTVLKGTRLSYNAGTQEAYVSVLESMTEKMIDNTTKEILKLFNTPNAKEFFAMDESISSQARILTNALSNKFFSIFSKYAKPIAEEMVRAEDRVSKNNLKYSLTKLTSDITLNPDVLTSTLKETLKASVAENVELIKSIAVQYQAQVQGAVMRSITTGNGLQDLIPALEKYDGMTHRRAKNIALDQTRKVYNSVNSARMQGAGVKKFEWVHSGGGQRPREDHIAMDGQIYSFDDLPVIDQKTGERGIPGQAINCMCTMIPVVEFNEGV